MKEDRRRQKKIKEDKRPMFRQRPPGNVLYLRGKAAYLHLTSSNFQNLNSKFLKAMTQESKNKWSVIINVVLTTITAILSAFGLA